MANRNFSRVQALNHEIKIIGGQFQIAAGGAVNSQIQGIGWSAANSGTGQFTITLQDSYVGLLSANFTVQAATAVDLVPQIVSNDVVTAKTVIIKLLAAAVATNPAATTVVHFTLMLRNSAVA